MTSTEEVLHLHFPECIAEDFPDDFPVAWAAVEEIVQAISGADLTSLARHVPALATFDWAGYLRCSAVRMVHASTALSRHGVSRGWLLDQGSYLGNFALMFARMGYQVDALDSYRAYGDGLVGCLQAMCASGVRILDTGHAVPTLDAVPPETYDVVLCMGVIEHVPHTPRLLLEAIDRILKPGGHLVLDTPNLAYLYNRQKIASGVSVMPALPSQYFANVPFMGHHREYTVDEIAWMIEQLHHDLLSVETFNYSSYGVGELRGRDIANHWMMIAAPDCREVILTVSRKTRGPGGATKSRPGGSANWMSKLAEPASYWKRRMPELVSPSGAEIGNEGPAGRGAYENESLRRQVECLQMEVYLRDEMLAQLEARLQVEIRRHADLLVQMQPTVRAEVGECDGMPVRPGTAADAEPKGSHSPSRGVD